MISARSGLDCAIDAHRLGKRLWIGSAPSPGNDLSACGFDVVVLCAKEYQPRGAFNCKVIHAGIDDAELSRSEMEVAFVAAKRVAALVRSGSRVLVTCMAGRNRSGLVSAMALVMLSGMSGRQAVRHVQRNRPLALTNPSFTRFLAGLS